MGRQQGGESEWVQERGESRSGGDEGMCGVVEGESGEVM